MQVRKYEASTIKEAVDQVKKDLGPDAIILSTREIAGNRNALKKVMITAAVAEQTYQKKRVVESNLSEKERQKLSSRPARHQREVINSIYSNLQEKIETKRRTSLAGVNYASIREEDEGYQDDPQDDDDAEAQFEQQLAQLKRKNTLKPSANGATTSPTEATTAGKRVKQAVLNAFTAIEKSDFIKDAKPKTVTATGTSKTVINKADTARLEELKGEIKRLQSLLQSTSGNSAAKEVPPFSGAKHGIVPEASFMYDKLINAGCDDKTAAMILKQAHQQLGENVKKRAVLDAYTAKWVLNAMDVVKNPLVGRFHFFVGPRGVGKTSTLVKMASHLVLKERKKVAIISADTNKVGAVDQLRIYSHILNVPFAVVKNSHEVISVIQQLNGVDYILFDTQGLSLSQMEEIEWIKNLIPQNLGDARIHLVLSAMMRDEELSGLSRRFKAIHFHDVMFTNLDQVHRYGFLINFQRNVPAPFYAFGMGPMIPEDFEWATKERVLDLIFKISKTKWEGEKHD
ncbi:MAG: hypothetical protein K2Q26_03785 [Bdellovibrionales bacterium]|nr:hypothetical protein [Bdellovibrionales bacterium]